MYGKNFTNQIYSNFFICDNEDILILILPFILCSLISQNYFVKIAIDGTLFFFCLVNLISGIFFNDKDNNSILPLNKNFTNINNITADYLFNFFDHNDTEKILSFPNKDVNKSSIFQYDLLILILFAFLHTLHVLKIKKKFDKMVNFITEKNLKQKPCLNEKSKKINKFNNDLENTNLYDYEIIDLNNYLIDRDIKEELTNKIHLKYFSGTFSSVEFSCLISGAKVRFLDSNFKIIESDKFDKIYYISSLSNNSYLELKSSGNQHSKIDKNYWIGIENFLMEFSNDCNKSWLNNIKYIACDRLLSTINLGERNQMYNVNDNQLINNKGNNLIDDNKKDYFERNRNILPYTDIYHKMDRFKNTDYILEWDKNFFLEILEQFKDEIFLKKLYFCWLQQISLITKEKDEEISRSLKVLYEKKEMKNKEEKFPMFRKLSDVERREVELMESHPRKSNTRISIENIEL